MSDFTQINELGHDPGFVDRSGDLSLYSLTFGDRKDNKTDLHRQLVADTDSGLERLLLTAATAKAPAAPVEKHTMSSRVLSWGWTFDIKDGNGQPEGIVDQKLLNFRKTFEYRDENNQKKATGQERLFSWGTKIDIYDEKGQPIGGIQEQVFKSWWKPYTVYSVVDAQGKEIAKSEKLEAFETDFTLSNNKGEKIATIHRPWLNFIRDNWTISITKPDEVDKRILYMIPAYKTSADAERRARAQEEEEDSSKQDEDN